VNRDSVLWGLAGILVGFVAAYVLFEAVGSRQPPRAIAGQAPPAASAPGAPAAAPGGGVNAPFLEQRARELEQAVAEDPSVAQSWLDLANLRFDLQRYADAAQAYERYLALSEPHPDVLTDLGVAYHMSGRPQDALTQFDRAQEMDPDHWKSQFNEVVVLAFDLGRIDDAERVLARLRELQPDNPDVERLATEVTARRSAA
jgi:tetratricopeptide (TPR) repeat protein